MFRYIPQNFNSRTSCEVRPTDLNFEGDFFHFNSRTSCEVRQHTIATKEDIYSFQLTHLLRGATLKLMNAKKYTTISTHAPLARCDRVYMRCGAALGISTHAPLARCDKYVIMLIYFYIHFNSRTSCEVRQQKSPIFRHMLTPTIKKRTMFNKHFYIIHQLYVQIKQKVRGEPISILGLHMVRLKL